MDSPRGASEVVYVVNEDVLKMIKEKAKGYGYMVKSVVESNGKFTVTLEKIKKLVRFNNVATEIA